MATQRRSLKNPDQHSSEKAMLGALVARLSSSWSVVNNVRLVVGYEHCAIDMVLLHEDHGIALITIDRGEWVFPELAIRLLRETLTKSGFDRRYPGTLPVIFLSVNREERRSIADEIADAFRVEEPIGVREGAWVGWAARTLADALDNDADAASFRHPGQAGVTDVPVRTGRIGRAMRYTAIAVGAAGVFAGVMLGSIPVLRAAFNVPASARVAASTLPAQPGTAMPEATVGPSGRRLLSSAAVAAYLGLNADAFRARYGELRAAGFPAPEPVTGNFDQAAIDRWIEARHAQLASQ